MENKFVKLTKIDDSHIWMNSAHILNLEVAMPGFESPTAPTVPANAATIVTHTAGRIYVTDSIADILRALNTRQL